MVLIIFKQALNAQSNVSYSNIFFNNLYPNSVSGNTAEQTHYHFMSTGGGTGGSPLLDVKWWGGLNFESEGGNVRLKSPYGTLFMSIGGNTGINTEDPKATLDVRGSARINSLSGYSHLGLGQQTNDMIIADNSAEKIFGGGYFFRVHNDSAPSQYIDALMIDDNGNVGIGGTKPTAKLDVNSAGQRVLLNYQNKSSVSFIPNNGNSWFHISHGLNNDLAISQGGNVDFQRLVTITNSGNVGIGKNNPLARLDVLGSIIVGDYDNYFSYNAADINLKASSRGTGGRAIVHDVSNVLTLNYAGDFSGGTRIGSNVIIKNTCDAAYQGKLEAKEVKVTLTPTADFVFEEKYDLPKLENVEKFIKENKHLPEVASAKEMEKEGVNVGEFQIKLLQKIEELTLYTIEQNRQLKLQAEKIEKLEQALTTQKIK